MLGIAVLHAPLAARAAEVDEFSYRRTGAKLADSQPAIEAMINRLMQEGVDRANAKGRGCQDAVLYKELRDHFHHHFFGDFVKRALRDPGVHPLYTPKPESIYRDVKTMEALGLNKVVSGSDKILSPVLRLGNVVVGLDKFEHFFAWGYKYFKIYHWEKRPIEDALALGERSEQTYLGATNTGVYSYADLAANFQGHRFWNHILGYERDIFGSRHQRGPFVTCRQNRWQVSTRVKLDHYVDLAWSESVNCSAFRIQTILQKVTSRAREMGFECRGDSAELKKLAKRYGWLGNHLINLRGWYSLKEEAN
ncbi:MAG TPA: hypothetical protein VM901_01020 [Bdellovibrionota bacterium]|nr:hypothetical protein [Bdellovibrionota bacterium]